MPKARFGNHGWRRSDGTAILKARILRAKRWTEMKKETDEELCENAAYALSFEVASRLIKVAVEKGWLTLMGQVPDEADKAAAEKAVLHIRGIKGIRNYITVSEPPKPAETVRYIEAVPAPQES
jgi:osmotically-inducible protein OsmY